MPAAARWTLLRHLPMAAAVLALVLPAAPALAQSTVSITAIRINGVNMSFDAWEGVEVTEGSSIRFTITGDPAPTADGEVYSIGGSWISHENATAGFSNTVRKTSIAHFNHFTLDLGSARNPLANQPFLGTYTDNSTYDGNRTITLRVNRRAASSPGCRGNDCVLYKVDDAGSNSRDLVITVTDEDDAYDPDVNASGSVDANDALILYYAYSLRNDLGTGR